MTHTFPRRLFFFDKFVDRWWPTSKQGMALIFGVVQVEQSDDFEMQGLRNAIQLGWIEFLNGYICGYIWMGSLQGILSQKRFLRLALIPTSNWWMMVFHSYFHSFTYKVYIEGIHNSISDNQAIKLYSYTIIFVNYVDHL